MNENEMIWATLQKHRDALTSVSQHLHDLQQRVESLEAAIVASLNLFEPKKVETRK